MTGLVWFKLLYMDIDSFVYTVNQDIFLETLNGIQILLCKVASTAYVKKVMNDSRRLVEALVHGYR